MLKFLFIIANVMSFALSMVELSGKCPEIKTVNYFNISAYTNGLWYQVARYPNDEEKQGDCSTMEINLVNNVVKFNVTDITKGIPNSFVGYIQFTPNSEKSGTMDLMSEAFREIEGSDDIPIYVIDTDNRNYAVTYECRFDKTKNISFVSVWITSRKKKLEGDAKTAVDNFLKTSKLIDANKLVWNHFDDEACRLKA